MKWGRAGEMWSGLGELNLLRTQYHTQSLSHTVTLMRTHEHTHARTITDTETHCPLIQAGKRSQSHTVMPVITVSEQRHGHIGYIHHLMAMQNLTASHIQLLSHANTLSYVPSFHLTQTHVHRQRHQLQLVWLVLCPGPHNRWHGLPTTRP